MNVTPSAKTSTTITSGAIVTVAAWVVNGLLGIEVPEAVWAAIATIVMGIIALVMPAKSGTYVDLAKDDGYLNAEDIAAEHADDADIDDEHLEGVES